MMQSIQQIQTLGELQSWQTTHLGDAIDQALTEAALPSPLDDACRYAMSNGGKRVRPLLVLATFLTVSAHTSRSITAVQMAWVLRAMAAVEMVHGYSLVHDDLPCMDDDELRRGKPTCHVVYGEGVALLAGDALQSIAFEVLAGVASDEQSDIGLKLLQTLVPRARRMVTGQMLDIEGEQKTLSQDELEAIHRDKTGALIEASVMMGGICADADDAMMQKLGQYARAVGLAFQVQDDVLDVTADTATLGKPAGSDEKLEKSTYVKLLGVDGARRYANQLFDEARAAVAQFGDDNLLLQIVQWLQVRSF